VFCLGAGISPATVSKTRPVTTHQLEAGCHEIVQTVTAESCAMHAGGAKKASISADPAQDRPNFAWHTTCKIFALEHSIPFARYAGKHG